MTIALDKLDVLYWIILQFVMKFCVIYSLYAYFKIFKW